MDYGIKGWREGSERGGEGYRERERERGGEGCRERERERERDVGGTMDLKAILEGDISYKPGRT